jgi:hypothetical protein
MDGLGLAVFDALQCAQGQLLRPITMRVAIDNQRA